MDSNKDLLAKAQEYSSNNVDLYELLQVDPTVTEEKDIKRAWRKESLKYHPDKLKDAFDPEKWELFETARDILLDAAARAAYDNARKAALLRKVERDRVQGERKRFIDELEAGELEAKRKRLAEEERARELEREKARMAEENRRRMAEEAERFKRENLERMERERVPDEYDEQLATMQKRLDELAEKKRLKAEKKSRRKEPGQSSAGAAAATDTTATTTAPDTFQRSRSSLNWDNLATRCAEAQRAKEAKMATTAGA